MKALILVTALTLGRPVWATETGVIIVASVVALAFTLIVARWAWRFTA